MLLAEDVVSASPDEELEFILFEPHVDAADFVTGDVGKLRRPIATVFVMLVLLS